MSVAQKNARPGLAGGDLVVEALLVISLVLASLSTLAFGANEAWKHDILDQVQLAMIFIL